MNTLTLHGKLIFDPEDITNKHIAQSSWKKTAMVMIDYNKHKIDNSCNYYCWFINKRYGLQLEPPLRGMHLTIINDKFNEDELVNFERAKAKYNNTDISFKIDLDVRSDGTHWWFRTECDESVDIRRYAGLSDRPYYGLHTTIGRANPPRDEFSRYIHHLVTKYGDSYN